jgi:hypothetical protein
LLVQNKEFTHSFPFWILEAWLLQGRVGCVRKWSMVSTDGLGKRAREWQSLKIITRKLTWKQSLILNRF